MKHIMINNLPNDILQRILKDSGNKQWWIQKYVIVGEDNVLTFITYPCIQYVCRKWKYLITTPSPHQLTKHPLSPLYS
jgi:hypothetical protein